MASKYKSKKSFSKVPPKTADQIIAISLQHPKLGARRLVPLLKKRRISVSATAIQGILRRHGLQSREKRLAKIKKQARKPKSLPKKTYAKIPDKVARRIVEVSLKNPEWGARRLAAELEKKKIVVSESSVYTILKRNGLQTRQLRFSKLEERAKKARKPKPQPQKPSTKITDDVAERICEISLKNPEFGAKRLIPLLKKRGILLSSSAVYRILKRYGLQTRTLRIAKIQETIAEPMLIPKRFPEKIPPEVVDRVIELSSQHPDYGARRLIPELQKEAIFVSASTVYTILKQHGLETLKKRLSKLEEAQALEVSLLPKAEITPEAPEQIPEPGIVVSIPPKEEVLVPADMPKPVPEPAAVAPAEPERRPLKKTPIKPIKKRSHRVFYPLYLLLLFLIAYLGFNALRAIQYARLETVTRTAVESVKVGITSKVESAASVQSFDGYRQIWERNLFNTSKVKESNSDKKISIDKLAVAKKDLGLELVGTVVAENPKLSRAIIDNRSIRKQEAYREGESAGKVKIKKILRNNVVITTAKGDALLTVEVKESGKRPTPYPAAQEVDRLSSSVQRASGVQRRSVRTSSINLKRDEVEASLADIESLMEQVRLSPYMQGDQPSGFRVGSIPADSVLRKMGLRNRDVIVGVDEESITSPDQASDFFQKLAGGGEVIIKLKRRRRTRQIKLNIE